ncbi:putative clathrin assembly protein At1g33340 [Pistacia vera]|uniref:putative clathrin assembly protein At1g33340 n=1 Tax=Pistacia vera TaxID=55513 RepID=UPI001262C5F1|nr:putative clathrin assembly protein At1g33340 [Pistacia vera]
MGVDIQGKLRLALGSVKDHATIGKAIILHNYDGKGFSDIEIAVVRATGHDYGPIDDKYMHEILFLVTNSPGSISFLAERISRRLVKTRDRLVALKTLLLIHRLLRGGNRYFEQQLRNAHVSGHLQLSTRWFITNSDPSVCFLHKYAAYLEERMGWVINQAGKLEPVMSTFEEKSMDMVFRKLPRCQGFIDKVLKSSTFDFLPSDNLIQAAMINTLKESFQVYMAFSEGVAALVNMFFDLARPARSLACEILKRASTQSQELHHLYEKCKRFIENKNLEYPSVQIITVEHVLALEQCLGCTSTSSYWRPMSSKIGPTPSILNCLTRLTDKGGEKDKQKGDDSMPSTLFSCTLETKISKVWVVFEDEEFNKPGLFSGTVSDLPVHHQSTSGIVVNGGEITTTCNLNPFAT